MSSTSTQNTEALFVDQLTSKLTENKSLEVEQESRGNGPDIVVKDSHSGKRIFIEFKDAGPYGELPISSILSINDQVKRIATTDTFILITFSSISNFLSKKLKELNVTAFSKPSVDDVLNKVQVALSA
ncbi:MAG TPA: hypothetical protein VL978_18760 [Puia sp.]|nr:hypothetical protein [Puia sp.]